MKISFVIPCYNSVKSIEKVTARVEKVMTEDFSNCTYNIILVDDCSEDDTKRLILEMAGRNKNMIAVSLAKNAGQHGAVMAGFRYADGDAVVTLDDDGQTPVENLKKMFAKLEQGYDVVSAKYVIRHQKSGFRRMGTFLNRKMMKWLIEGPDGITVSVFLVLRKFVVDEIVRYKQPYPYLSGLVLRVTYNICDVEMEQEKRTDGQSGYSAKKLIALWLNGFTAFSIKPLRIATMCGLFASGAGILFAVMIVIRKIFYHNIQVGWSSLVVISLILGGLNLFVIGIMGEYVGRIYMCINHTPQYVIRDITGIKEKEQTGISQVHSFQSHEKTESFCRYKT